MRSLYELRGFLEKFQLYNYEVTVKNKWTVLLEIDDSKFSNQKIKLLKEELKEQGPIGVLFIVRRMSLWKKLWKNASEQKIPVWIKQFILNFFWCTVISWLWYYGCFSQTKSFWLSTIIVNVVTFFLGRYLVFKEGKK